MPVTPRGEKTQAAFREAARSVFAEKGYFNAKIADISAAAGRSPGSFYNYYENKAALLEDMAEDFIADVLGQTTKLSGTDPYANIHDVVSVFWTTYQRHLSTMIGLFQMSMRDEKFAQKWQVARSRGLENIMRGIHKAARAGYAEDLSPEALASALMSMMEFFCWTWLANGGEPGLAKIDDETAIETLTQVWFRALYFLPDPVPQG